MLMHYKRMTAILAAICISFVLASCKFPASFVVMNQSGELMEVSYAFKNTPGTAFNCPEGKLFTAPSVVSADELGNRHLEWTQLGSDEFVCWPSTRTVYVPVGPGIALKVMEHEDPGGEYGRRDLDMFPVDSLLINGASGSMRYTGEQVLKAFTRTEGTMTFHIKYQ